MADVARPFDGHASLYSVDMMMVTEFFLFQFIGSLDVRTLPLWFEIKRDSPFSMDPLGPLVAL